MQIYKFENQEFYLLSEILKELNVKSKGHNYCNYLDIKLYQFKHPRSGHMSHFIMTTDFEKLKEFCEKYNSKERRLIFVKLTNNINFGYDYPAQSKIVINKMKSTNLEKYGVENYNNREKAKETCLKKYGVENTFQYEEFKEKSKETLIKHFGSLEEYYKYHDIKLKQTKLERYGDENYVNIDKYKQSCLEKYGVDNVFKSDEIKNKIEDVFLEKYGEHFSKSEKGKRIISNSWSKKSKEEMKEIVNKHFHKWIFDNQLFDSKWEIYYYFYLKDNNIKFEREYPFDYEFNDKKCVYLCDFHLLDTNEFVEVKGSHLIDENGNLKEHYKNDNQNKLNAKTKCMIDNNVKIISKNEIKFYIDYFKKNCNENIIDNKTGEKLKYIRI